MPIPKPYGNENEQRFMDRCLATDDMMKYPRNQRVAICLDSFQGKLKKGHSMEEQTFEEEQKFIPIFAEIKAYEDDEDEDKKKYGRFTGYASIFGNRDLGNDVMMEGAFAKSLARKGAKGIKMLFQHKTDEPIGIYEEITEDRKGLYVKGKIALETQKGKETFELMKMGAIDGLSIGYRVNAKGQMYDDRRKKRYLKEVELMEISAVTFPMNQSARISAVKGNSRTIREWERHFRDEGGLSRSESKQAASAVYKALSQRDVDATHNAIDAIKQLTSIIKGV